MIRTADGCRVHDGERVEAIIGQTKIGVLIVKQGSTNDWNVGDRFTVKAIDVTGQKVILEPLATGRSLTQFELPIKTFRRQFAKFI